MRKGVVWILGGSAAAVAALVVAGGVLILNENFTTAAARFAIEKFDAQIPAKIAFTHLSVKPWRGQIAIDGFEMGIPGKPQEKFVEARQVIVTIDLWALVSQTVRIKRLHLVNPEVTLIHRGNNNYNLLEIIPKSKPDDKAQGNGAFALDRVTVDGGHVTYRDDPRDAMAELPHLDASLNLDLTKGSVAGQVSLSKGWVRQAKIKQPIDSFRIDFDKQGQGLTFNELKLDTGPTGIAVRGRIEGFDQKVPTLALDGMVKTNLAPYANIEQVKDLKLAGLATVDFNVKGVADDPTVVLHVTGQKLKMRAVKVPKLTAALIATRHQVQINHFDAQVWNGRVQAAGVAPLTPEGRLDATVTLSDLDVGAAVKALELKGDAAAVQGRMSARVAAKGAGLKPEAYDAHGWLRVAASLPYQGRRLPLTARTDFRWAQGALALAGLDARALGGHLTGTGRVTPLAKRPAYAFRGTVADLEVAAVERALALDLPVSGRAGATLDIQGVGFDKPVIVGNAQVRAAGALDAKTAGNRKALPFSATADVKLAGQVIRIVKANAQVFGGTLVASGESLLDGNLAGLVADVRAKGLNIAALNDTFGGTPGPLGGTLDARIKLANQKLDIASLDARVLGGRLTAKGRVLLAGQDPRYDLTVNAAGLKLDAARQAMQIADLSVDGTAGATIRVRGAGANFQAEGPVNLVGRAFVQDPTTPGARRILPLSVVGSIAAAKRSVRLLPLTAKVGGTTLVASGTLDLDRRSDLTVVGDVSDAPALARLVGVKDLVGGDAKLRARASGPAGNIHFEADLALGQTEAAGSSIQAGTVKLAGQYARDLKLNGRIQATTLASGKTVVSTLDVPFDYQAPLKQPSAGTLRMQGLRAAIGGGQVVGRASVALATKRYDVDIKTEGLTLGDVGGLARDAGVVAPVASTSRVDVVPPPARLKDRTAPQSIQLGFAPAPGGRPPGLRQRPDALAVAVSSPTPMPGPTPTSVKVSPRPAGDVPAGPHTEHVVPMQAATPLSLAVKGQGTFAQPKADIQARMGAFMHAGRSYRETRLDVKLDGMLAIIDGVLFGGDARVKGRVPVGRGDGRLEVIFKDTRLAPLFALVPASALKDIELPTGGEISGTIVASGPFTTPKRVKVEVDLSELSVAYADIELANKGNLKIGYADDRLRIDSFRVAGAGTDIGVNGVLALSDVSAINLDGKIDLALLARISPTQFSDAAGRATIDGQLRGRLGDPSMSGALTIRGGELETRNLPQPVRDLNASIRLSKDRVFLDELRATLGHSGRIQATGGATLGKNFVPEAVNLQLDAREIAVRAPGTEVVANAELVFQGRPNGGRLDGQIRVLEGEYTQDIDLTGSLTARKRAGGGTSGPSVFDNPLLKKLAMRIQVLIPDQFMVDNNLAKAELRGDLVVMGTPSRPIVVGRAEAIDGQVFFQDRTYKLEEATVDFIDPNKLTPYMHVVATSSIQAIDVRLQANGTPEQLKLDLSSSPALSQTDILTLIATGQTPAQLQEGGGNSFAAASNLLLGQVAGGVSKGVTDGGVVDVLSIKPGSTDAAEPVGGSVTVGKRINEKLTLTYTQDIAAPAGRTPGRLLIFDYLLSDAVVLKLEQNLGGGFNASARYRIPIR